MSHLYCALIAWRSLALVSGFKGVSCVKSAKIVGEVLDKLSIGGGVGCLGGGVGNFGGGGGSFGGGVGSLGGGVREVLAVLDANEIGTLAERRDEMPLEGDALVRDETGLADRRFERAVEDIGRGKDNSVV